MEATKALIKSIKEWDENRDTEVNDLVSVLRRTLHKLGADIELKETDPDKLFNKLQERISYLVESEGMNEDFLVTSTVKAITELLEDTIKNHGKQIIASEQVLEELRNKGEEGETIEAQIRELKDRDRKMKATAELDEWKIIVAEEFSSTCRELWRAKKTENYVESLLADWEEVPQEVKEIIGDVPFGVLAEHAPLADIKKLDVEKAEKIRKSWQEEKEK